jgi:hypothetical protein
VQTLSSARTTLNSKQKAANNLAKFVDSNGQTGKTAAALAGAVETLVHLLGVNSRWYSCQECGSQ